MIKYYNDFSIYFSYTLQYQGMKKRILVIIFFFFGIYFLSTKIRINANVEDFSVRKLLSGKPELLNPPIGTGYSVHISESKPVEIEFPFTTPVSLSGFSVFFPGNLHLVSSYLPREFEVYFKSTNDKWNLLDSKTDNRQSVYQYNNKNNLLVKALKISISNAAFDDSVQISDLKFYSRQKVPLFDFYVAFIDSHVKDFVSYLIFSLIMFFFIVIPGYAILSIAGEKWGIDVPKEYKLILSPVFSILSLGLVTTIYLIANSTYWFYLYLLLFGSSVFFLGKKRLFGQIFSEAKWPLLIIFLVLLVVNSLQAKRDFLYNLNYIEPYLDRLEFIPIKGGYFGYHADNTLPWGIAREFLHRAPLFSEAADKYRLEGDGNNVLDRTPLLPLITTPILFFFGESHFIYQRFLNVLMSLYYGASFLVLAKIFSDKTAKITALLLLLSGHITFQVFNTEVYYKYFAIYPILIALLLWFDDSRNNPRYRFLFIGLLLAMAYLIHPMTLFFSGVLFIAFVFGQKSSEGLTYRLLMTFLLLALTVILWTGFTYYAKKYFSNGIPTRIGIYENELISFNIESLKNIFYNLINFFIPDVLSKSGTYTNIISKDYLMQQFLRLSLIAAITPLMFVWLIFSLASRMVWKKYFFQLLFGIGPFVLYLTLLHKYSFGHYSVFYPFTVPFLLATSVECLKNKGRFFRSTFIISFPLFSLLYIRYLSGTYSALRYLSPSVRLLTYPILIVYLIGVVLLTWQCLSKEKR